MKSYKEITHKAMECIDSMNKEYKLGVSSKWSYYMAKAILTPNKDIKKIKLEKASKPTGTHISRNIKQKDYIDIAKRLVEYCEKNQKLPNYIQYKTYQIKVKLYTYILAKILVYNYQNKQYPAYVSVNSKVFTEPTETHNQVYDAFVKKYGKVKLIDDVMEIISNKFKYGYYYDDQLSNTEVINKKYGNCTDLTQMLANIGEALNYKVKCIHVQCKTSGTGHVFLKLKKEGGDWFIRDPAAVAGGKPITNVWCRDGIILGENPGWWMENKNR